MTVMQETWKVTRHEAGLAALLPLAAALLFAACSSAGGAAHPPPDDSRGALGALPGEGIDSASGPSSTETCWGAEPPDPTKPFFLPPLEVTDDDPDYIRGGETVLFTEPHYWNLRDIAADSDAVLVGTVTASEPRPFDTPTGDMGFTVATLDVDTVLRGPVATGEAVTILESGAKEHRPRIYQWPDDAPAEKLKPPPYDDGNWTFGHPVEVRIMGVPVMEEGGRYLVFLMRYGDGPLASDAYRITGVYQGKWKITEGGALDITGQVPLRAVLNGCPLDEVAASIEAAVAEEPGDPR